MGTRSKLVAGVVAPVVAGISVGLPSAPAEASPFLYGVKEWDDVAAGAPLVGGHCGGETSGGFVRATQAMAWASGGFGTPTGANAGQIDGQWGPATKQAIKTVQGHFELEPVDGCVGRNTWQQFRARRHATSNDGHYQYFAYTDQGGVTLKGGFCWYTAVSGTWYVWDQRNDNLCLWQGELIEAG